jgi:hypothetical protein
MNFTDGWEIRSWFTLGCIQLIRAGRNLAATQKPTKIHGIARMLIAE